MGIIYQASKTIVDTINTLYKTGEFFSPEELSNKRLQICSMCPDFDGSKCSHCGCFMSIKTKLSAATCPLGHWEDKIVEELMLGEMSPDFKTKCCGG